MNALDMLRKMLDESKIPYESYQEKWSYKWQYAGEDLPEEDLISCENCGKVIKGYGRMSASEVLSIAQKKYGGCYCADCMTKSAK